MRSAYWREAAIKKQRYGVQFGTRLEGSESLVQVVGVCKTGSIGAAL